MDRHGRDALEFCNLSGCEQLVLCTTHIADNRLNRVMADATDIYIDVFVDTPLENSNHCIASCVLCDEQSVPEYNVRSAVFRKHRTNWDIVRGAAKSFTRISILKSANPLDAPDRAIGEVIRRFVPTMVLHSRSGNKHGLMPAAYAKQMAYGAWYIERNAIHWGRFVLARAKAQRVDPGL